MGLIVSDPFPRREPGTAGRGDPADRIGGLSVLSLTGKSWRFRDARERRWLPASVPGCVHADLQRAGVIPDPFVGMNEAAMAWVEERDWIYETEFTVPPGLASHEHVELVADGLDTVARVFLNGVDIGSADNMFVAHRWEVGTRLRRGVNRLQVRFDSPARFLRTHRLEHVPREINDPVGGCTRLRKQQCSFGWDWGPRLATSGIWQDIRLEAWTGNRLVDVRVTQTHRRDGSVALNFIPQLAHRDASITLSGTLSLEGQAVGEIVNYKSSIINRPALWWPNGQGAQPLYQIELEARDSAGRLIGTWSRRLGLRTITLDRHADRWGESFQFKVNGRAIFAKGANWIPAHALTAGLKRADYEPLLQSAAAAHMNMIRVWGGGIYEHEAFYDLCDELGLLVWQDFMFACTLYPGDAAFVESVRTEAEQQVARLRHRACLALWCGNNEIESLNGDALKASATTREHYDAIFNRLLPEVVTVHDGVTPYWASSPQGSQNEGRPKDAERLTGDWHDWDVWHARHPVKHYEKSGARFVSEFGMQSFPSAQVARRFCAPEELNVYSPTMEARQKNPSGNAIMADYVARRYRFAGDYAGQAYLSQLNQAFCMKVAVEHWRRSQPRTMGALYWQLNDVWPAISWSSLEFGGGWKPLHHAARHFFAPVLLSAHVPGDETRGIGNRLKSDVRGADLYTVSDHPVAVTARLRWELWLWPEGRVLRRGTRVARIVPGEARRREQLDFARAIAQHGRENLLLRLRLEPRGLPAAEDVVLFTAPRHLDLQAAPISLAVKPAAAGRWSVELESAAYHHGVWLDLPGSGWAASDNGFDLLPGVTRRIELSGGRGKSAAALRKALRVRSLVHAYQSSEDRRT